MCALQKVVETFITAPQGSIKIWIFSNSFFSVKGLQFAVVLSLTRSLGPETFKQAHSWKEAMYIDRPDILTCTTICVIHSPSGKP
jgi:hypothetical protein